MARPSLEKSLEAASREEGRPGICVFALDPPEWPAAKVVPHPKACVTTPSLLREAGLELEHTRDRGDERHYTVWGPDVKWNEDTVDEAEELADRLRAAFGGPLPTGEISDEWDSDHIRGLQSPSPSSP